MNQNDCSGKTLKPWPVFVDHYRLVPEHNGKGYATEAAKAIIDFAEKQIGATYLVAVADPENIPSQRVMQRLGMTYKAIEQHYDVPCVVYDLNLGRPD